MMMSKSSWLHMESCIHDLPVFKTQLASRLLHADQRVLSRMQMQMKQRSLG